MRRGFTMIELIFVIVIIGILAAVAIPKLAATRDDAQDTKVKANVATCLTEYVASYTATGTADTSSEACSGLSITNPTTNTVKVSGTLSDGTTFDKNATFKGSRISV